MNEPRRQLLTKFLTVKYSDLEEVVLPHLRGRVFHLTPTAAYPAIVAEGTIRSNRDGRLGFTYPQSKNSWGRKQGYVCLFDLRDVSAQNLQDALDKLYFLNPSEKSPTYLFLDPSEYGRLVGWRAAPVGAMVIPHVECWYPSDLPVSRITDALIVAVEADDTASSYAYAMRSICDPELLATSPQIGASSIAELERRVEEWSGVALAGGLSIEGWDPARVWRDGTNYFIRVSATREKPRTS